MANNSQPNKTQNQTFSRNKPLNTYSSYTNKPLNTNALEEKKTFNYDILSLIISLLLGFALFEYAFYQPESSDHFSFTNILNFMSTEFNENWSINIAYNELIPLIEEEWLTLDGLRIFINGAVSVINGAVRLCMIFTTVLYNTILFISKWLSFIFYR